MTIFFITFIILLLIGVPISISIGASAVLGCLVLDYPLMVIGQKMVTGVDSYLLIAIPLFILAGNLMNAGKITDKIFSFAKELVAGFQAAWVMPILWPVSFSQACQEALLRMLAASAPLRWKL